MDAEAKTAGAGIVVMRGLVEELVGAAVLGRVVASLPRAVGDEWSTATSLSWVRVDTTAAVIDAVAAATGRDPDALFDDLVRRTTEKTFRTIWRVLLGLASDAALVSRTPGIYARTRSVGRLGAELLEPGQARLVLTGWPGITERSIRAVGIGVEVVLGLTGRRGVRWKWVRTEDGAVLRLAWEV